MRVQPRIHRWPRQGQRAPERRANNSIARERAGGVDAVALRQVVGRVDEDDRVPRAKGDSGQQWPDPVHGRHARPREPELAQRDEDGADADNADHGFRGWPTGGRVGLVSVDHAADEGFGADDEEAADGEAGEGEAGEAEGPVAGAGEDDGVGDEAEVEDAVDDGDVDVPEDADGFGGDHDEGSAEVDFHELGEGEFVVVVAGPVAVVVGFFAAEGCFLFEEGGGIAFFEDADEDPADGSDHHDDPVGEAPAEVLG